MELNILDAVQKFPKMHARKVREVKVGNKKAFVVYVPVPNQHDCRKIQQQVASSLENRFGSSSFFFISDRRILKAPRHGKKDPNKQKRPVSRTKTAVLNAILEDIVYPSKILGKRIHYNMNGSQFYKIILDKLHKELVSKKIPDIEEVYGRLSGRKISITFSDMFY